MSTRYPGAVWRPQGHYQPNWIAKNAIILHTMVGYLESTDAMFRHDTSFSHFGVGGIWGGDVEQKLDGVVYQWQDLDFSAEANVEGNPYTFSIETADNAPRTPDEIAAWSPLQLDAIVNLCAWLCKTFDIPAVQLPNTRAGSRGIGWHEMGTHAHLVPGGLYYGDHQCPGPLRERQVVEVVIPRVVALLHSGNPLAGSPAPTSATPAATTVLSEVHAMLITYEGQVLLWNYGSTRESITVLTNPVLIHDLADHGMRWIKPDDPKHKAYVQTLAAISKKA